MGLFSMRFHLLITRDYLMQDFRPEARLRKIIRSYTPGRFWLRARLAQAVKVVSVIDDAEGRLWQVID